MTEQRVGGRLGERPAPEIREYLYGARTREALHDDFFHMTDVNRAHVVMLVRQEIISTEAGRVLLRALDDIERAGPEQLKLDTEREDLYFNYEHAVIKRTGTDVGGQLHTGRSRNDLQATTMRMHWREVLLDIASAVLDLRSGLLEQAAAHVETIMPGYTHLQPAQPITLGHYLTAIEQGLARDSERLFGALQRSDLCPLGAGALAGTGFHIDRQLTSDLLGFDTPVANTLDAVASRDYLLEALAAGAVLGVTLSRFAQDLYVWYTHEFGMIDFRDRVAGISSIMPQKKNPIVLENIRGRSAQVLGAFTAAAAGVRNTNYTNLIDGNREAFRLAATGLEELRIAVLLSRLAVENMLVRDELMLERCRVNFSTVTQLADTLVAEWDISFRQAHDIVGALVRRAVESGLDTRSISAELVEFVAGEVAGLTNHIDDELVRRALDPVLNVEVRCHLGGPAPASVLQLVNDGARRLEDDRKLLNAIQERWNAARKQLARYVAEYLG